MWSNYCTTSEVYSIRPHSLQPRIALAFFGQSYHNIGSHSVCSELKFPRLHPETDVNSNLFIFALVQLVFWNYLRTDQKLSCFIEFDSFCSEKFASTPVIAQFCYYGNAVSCYYFFRHSISHHQLVPPVSQLVCNTKVGSFSCWDYFVK